MPSRPSPSKFLPRAMATLLALGLHAVIGLVMVFGLSMSPTRVEPRVAIPMQATVVDLTQLQAIEQRDTDRARDEAIERRRAEEQAAAEVERQQQIERERQQALERKRQEQADEIEKRQIADQQAQDLAARERQRLAEQQQQLDDLRAQREEAEKARQQEQQRLAELEQQREKDREERQRRLEAEQRQQLIDLENQQLAQAEEVTLLQEWVAAIRIVVTQNWRRPVTANDAIRCDVRVDQLPGGDVVSAVIMPGCQADEITRRSIIDAVLRSEPLPYRGYDKVFRRQVTFEFVAEAR